MARPLTGRALVRAGLAAGAVLAARQWIRRRRRVELRGRAVLIAGGSRGLGLALAREFGRRGARVAICGRDADTLERARQDLAGRGIEVQALACDVGNRDQAFRTVEDLAARLGGLDVLVNVAGVVEVGPLETMTLADFDEAMRTNFWGPLHTTLAALGPLRARGGGRIVTVASIGGKVAVPHLLPYAASKFAVAGLSEGLRAELARDGILVTTVDPGLMRTGSPRHAIFKGRHRAEFAWFSVADALPGLSMDAERAARRIVEACRHGDASVVLGLPAKLAVALHALAPGVTADALGVVHRLLPPPGGIGTTGAPGRESASAWSPSWLTALGERAARALNQAA